MDEALTPTEETQLQAAELAAARLVWAELQPDEEKSIAAWTAAFADLLTGDSNEDDERTVWLIATLVMDCVYCLRQAAGSDEEALELARAHAWRRAPAAARFAATISGDELP